MAAVLAIAPVAGIPPKSADTILPAPCATSSILGLCLEPIIPSDTTHERRLSIPASTAIVSASGRSVIIISILTLGILTAGSPFFIVYRLPIVLTSDSAGMNLTITTDTITAISEGGILSSALNLGHMISIASATTPTINAFTLNVPILRTTALSLSIVSTVDVPAG